MVQDHTAHNVVATFLGTFLFSLAGIIALNTGVYESKGRIILFAMTLVVVALVLLSLIRWIDRLTKIGRVGETTRQVEAAAKRSLQARASSPSLGCNRWPPALAETAGLERLCCREFGYVQLVDVKKIAQIAESGDYSLYINAMPGKFVTPSVPLLWASRPLAEDTAAELLGAFTVADERSFEQDPRFGLCVLSEIAERASVKDPGTAIDVLGRLVVVLSAYAGAGEGEVECHRVWAPPLAVGDLFEDAFSAIARSGAEIFEIHARLQKCLSYLADLGDAEYREQAFRQSRLALLRSDASHMLEEEKERLRRIALH